MRRVLPLELVLVALAACSRPSSSAATSTSMTTTTLPDATVVALPEVADDVAEASPSAPATPTIGALVVIATAVAAGDHCTTRFDEVRALGPDVVAEVTTVPDAVLADMVLALQTDLEALLSECQRTGVAPALDTIEARLILIERRRTQLGG